MADEPIVEKQGHIRLKVCKGVALCRIKDPGGKYRDYYSPGQILPEWADHDEKQVAHFIRMGIIEPCDRAGVPTDPGRIIECVSCLITSGVEPGNGRPRASALLRSNGFHFSNETISKAVKCFNSNWVVGDPIP
jgi:hypothetical protein